MRHAILVLLLATACDKSKSNDIANAWTHEVTGTVSIDGASVVITECKVEKHNDTRISLLYAGGHLSFESGRLSIYQGDDDRNAMNRGTQLSCDHIAGERQSGTPAGTRGFARGKLAAECTAPVPVKLDVVLACGPAPFDSGAPVTGSAGSAS